MESPSLYVAIPAMDELEYLPATLQDLASQCIENPVEVFVCVNQPECYWLDPEKKAICEHNQELLQRLLKNKELSLHVLDYSSPEKGWKGKNFGVGWARRVMFEQILLSAKDSDIIVCLDADTRIRPNYLQTLLENFQTHPSFAAIAIPYYHTLSGEEQRDRAILRYELYMRNYAINLFQINSPYCFTAIGSAIALRTKTLRKIGNITPLKSGEDFYLLQKIRKMASIGHYNQEKVYPSSRYSSRVDFGTGPAIQKGTQGNWQSYPIFHHSLFIPIQQTYLQLKELFYTDIETDFLQFLKEQFKNNDLWKNIRGNVKDYAHFEHAFHEKADGLRLLQYVRQKHKQLPHSDEEALFDNFMRWMPDKTPTWLSKTVSFQELTVEQLNTLRDHLAEEEMFWRQKDFNLGT